MVYRPDVASDPIKLSLLNVGSNSKRDCRITVYC
jgi:hypothetical protein